MEQRWSMEGRVLENDELRVEISAHGAEVVRIYDKANNREALYDGYGGFWNRRSPVLFPMVGASYEGSYRFNGQVYPMKQHGFARDMDFYSTADVEGGCMFLLESSDETLKVYPFPFRLFIGYELSGRTLFVKWKIQNIGNRGRMYFNIGAHPAFNIGRENSFSDVVLDFHMDKSVLYYKLDPKTGCVEKKIHILGTDEGRLRLNDNFFDDDVYIFSKGSVSRVTMSVKDRTVVDMDCDKFPYFGIWSKPGAPFICLEPWYGMADRVGYQGDLSGKEGIVGVGNVKLFQTGYKMTF